MKYIIFLITGLLILTSISLVKADTTFFDNSNDFVMGVNNQINSGGLNPSCSPLWVCESWSFCSNNLRTRRCVDVNHCNSNEIPPFLLSCSQPLPNDRISGCVTFSNLNTLIGGWKVDVYPFQVLNDGINHWKNNIGC